VKLYNGAFEIKLGFYGIVPSQLTQILQHLKMALMGFS